MTDVITALVRQSFLCTADNCTRLTMKPKKRRVYRVKWDSEDRVWRIAFPGWGSYVEFRKADAVRGAVEAANGSAYAGFLAQVIIYKKNGKIQSERTYGRDPRKYPG